MELSNLNQNSIPEESSPSNAQYFTQQPLNKEGPKPIHLIYYNQEEKSFRVSEEAKVFLKSIKERVGIISVAGKYRTGKSFLLNRVIINKRNQGFGVGPTINPCTKGLWIWGDTLEGEYQGEKLKILLIDSEGIGAFDEDENHDTKIFLLALLLCSYFIYNSMGTIDENAINNLSLIINLSKELQIKSDVLGECDPDEIAKYFPSFLWVVRDFSLKLLDSQGNTLTSKEYLENAIQPQKGASDQVETKNRIRRLVKHFFKDRDCYTMVRPVEEEKALQSLQSMADENLRSEFVAQVNQLRSKIFKRVRPKSLNSKFITGEMLLELCYAYTDAINSGSVPNIQNAWSYVCQNECQRAINDSINEYENRMRKMLEDAKKQCNEDIIKKEHKARRDEAVTTFKSKAVGQDVSEFEIQLREGLSKKYKDIKNDFLRYCKTKSYQFLENDINNIKRNLQNDMYENLDKFLEVIERLKQKYNDEGPIFTGKTEIFTEVSVSLICKAADFLTITSKKETDVNLKKWKERVEEVEKEKSTMKQEYTADKKSLQQKIQDLEQDKNNSVRNEKLMEERLKYINEDREKNEKSITDKWKKKFEEKDEQFKQMETKYRNLEAVVKQKEEETFKRQNEFEKLNALIEQKLQLTENELSEYKVKYSQKEQDYKEMNKELYNSRKEVQQLTNQMNRLEQDKNDEAKQMKQDFELQLADMSRLVNQGSSGNPQVSEDQQQQWNKERLQMQVQMKSLTESLETQKKFQETFLQAFQNVKPHQDEELVITNKNLSKQIGEMQNKQKEHEKLIQSLRQYKIQMHYALSVQCKTCNRLYTQKHYQQHLTSCNSDNERMSTIKAQQNIHPLDIQITSCLKQGDDYLYEVLIERNSQAWKIQRKLSEFRLLFDELQNQFSSYALPYIPDEWLLNTQDEFYQTDLKKKLQMFLLDLVRIPFVRENYIFKQFLEMDSNYVDDDFNPRRNFQSMGPSTLNSISTAFTSTGNRSSVLDPFTSNNSQNMIMVNAKTMDGRKSMNPMLNSNILHQQQENMTGNRNKQFNGQNLLYNTKDQIQELVDDEDYSSLASHNRTSQMTEEMSSRPSVYSIKNQDIKYDGVFTSKANSPFQQVDPFGTSKSKERYSNMKNQGYYEIENPGVVPEDHDFEDNSFSNDLGELSASNKKPAQFEDDQYSQLQNELSSPQNELAQTKTNLAKKFENEGGSASVSSSQQNPKRQMNRYERSEDEDFAQYRQQQNISKPDDDADDDLQRE